MELRSDAFKYCHVYNRPFPKPVKGIGPWLVAFEILGFIAVITNISLISVHPEVRNYFSDFSDIHYFLIFVVAEVSELNKPNIFV
jgi:anoctamin-10